MLSPLKLQGPASESQKGVVLIVCLLVMSVMLLLLYAFFSRRTASRLSALASSSMGL